MASLLTVLDVTFVLLALYLVKGLLTRKKKGFLPPGPKPLPLIGNLLDMPRTFQWKTFSEWGKKYGDISYINVFGQPIIILNSAEDAINLLEKRSSITCDRPVLWMSGELIGWNRSLVISRYGELFRDIRKYMYRYIGNDKNMKEFHPIEVHETRRFLKHVVTEPETNINEHVRKTAGAIILKLAYGYEVQDGIDPYVQQVDEAIIGFVASSQPGSYMVDIFPLLRHIPAWFPGAAWKRKALQWRKDFDAVCDVPFQMAKDQMVAGVGEENFVTRNIDVIKTPVGDFRLKMAASSLYTGGADTTVSAITGFFLAMTLYPEVQRKAQAEIDAVIGNDRLPSFEDKEQLPYLNALVSEILRWNPVAPLAVPHTYIQDDTYKGYFFEKGTMIIANVWQMLHDPERYTDPLEFKPERFLKKDGKEPEQDPRFVAFGFGRRTCPGLHLAEASIFISCAMSLATLNVSKAVENGVEVTPNAEFLSGTISHPPPFNYSIKPRSAKAEALILSEDED